MRLPSLLRCLAPIAVLVLVSASWAPARAQEGIGDGADPLEQHLFPPELVMAHQGEIGLDASHRKKLIEEVQSLQADVVPWHFEMSEAVEALAHHLARPRVDESAAIALAERVTGLEARIKQRHLALLIRVKNLLSAEQQARLQELR